MPREPAQAIGRAAPSQERSGLFDDDVVAGVEEDPHPLGPRQRADVAVAEIETEQLGVVGRREPHHPRRPPAAIAEHHR
jgi:hypothetical protein